MTELHLGRLPGKIPVGLRELTYYVAGDLPRPASHVDVPNFGDWGMLGNDQYGDCGVAGLQHGFEADATVTGERERWPTDSDAVRYYLDYTSGADTGVVLADFLAHVRREGYYGHSVQAYAPVNVHDVPTLQTAVMLYDFAYCGITVTQSMQDAFQNHDAWTTEQLQEPPIGRHCVPGVGYDDHYLWVVTWGRAQPVTWSAWHQMAEEAWVVITGELVARHGDGRGVSLPALEADLDRLAA